MCDNTSEGMLFNLSISFLYSPHFHSFLSEDVEYYDENLMVFEKSTEVLY